MLKILVPVDGSQNAERAVAHTIQFVANSKEPVEVHLLNVQVSVLSGDVKMFIKQEDINAYYRDMAEKALATARKALDQAGVRYEHHIGVGQIADTIIDYVASKQCGQIIMGSRGLGSVSGLLLGSVATKVIQLAQVPVTLVK